MFMSHVMSVLLRCIVLISNVPYFTSMNLIIHGSLESSSSREETFLKRSKIRFYQSKSLSFIKGSGLLLHNMNQSCSFTCSALLFCVRGNFTPHNHWRNQRRLLVSNSSTGTKAWRHLFSYLTNLHCRSDFVIGKTYWSRSSLSCYIQLSEMILQVNLNRISRLLWYLLNCQISVLEEFCFLSKDFIYFDWCSCFKLYTCKPGKMCLVNGFGGGNIYYVWSLSVHLKIT